MNTNMEYDVAIIGAGPSGSVAAALLNQRGYRVVIVEKSLFPRFSIGESLLPQCMVFLEQAGLLDVVNKAGFQYKEGAAFAWRGKSTAFDFRNKFGVGPGTTFQVERAKFDKLLADTVAAKGVEIRYQCEVLSVDVNADKPSMQLVDKDGVKSEVSSQFILDASGFARVLPRLLKLDKPSTFPARGSLFGHVDDHISDPSFDRNKILIAIHPQQRDVWYWLIPLGAGRSSIGVVAPSEIIDAVSGDPQQRLQHFVGQKPRLASLLNNAEYVSPVRQISGYASDVSKLHGKGFALLGNAGEFLDPVFSSGVTIAMKSATLAADVLDRQLQGQSVDWETDYSAPLRTGIDCFRTYVSAWYEGSFQDIIFSDYQNEQIRQKICAILAGYAWDESNPFVKESERRLKTLVELVRMQEAENK